ncbi:hypothetical protein BA893_24055 [Vibrio natriegens]|nr:hypothetical protein BA893_24055 [Vibrio natriegens]
MLALIFASHFLMPRLHAFREQFEGVDIRLTIMVRIQDFSSDEVDVAIQWGFDEGSDWIEDELKDWKQYEPKLLMRDPKIICCTPRMAEHIQKPKDIL